MQLWVIPPIFAGNLPDFSSRAGEPGQEVPAHPLTAIARSWEKWQAGVNIDETLVELSNLIQICLDGKEGLSEAAYYVEKSQLKSFLRKASNQRERFAMELANHLLNLSKAYTKSLIASVQARPWSDLRESLAGKSEDEITARIEVAENHTIRAYERMLEMELPLKLLSDLEHQHKTIQRIGTTFRRVHKSQSAGL